MGSIKEVESSFGEQSARLAPKPPTRRLSWFEARFPHHPSIQEVAFRAGAAVLSLTGLSAMNPPEFNPLSLTARTALAQAASLAEQPAENLPLLERLLIGQSPTVELSIDGTDGETHLIQAFNTADCEVFIKSAEPTIPISSSFQNRPNPIPDAVRDAFTQASKAGGFKDSRIVLTPNLIPSESQPYPVIVDMPGLDKTSYQIQRSINTRPDGVSSLDVIFTLPQLIIDKLKIDSLFKDVFLQSLAFQYGAIVASGGNPQAMPDILTIEQQKAAGTITRFVRDFLSVETIAQEVGGNEAPLQPEAPFPKRFTNTDNSIVFNNTGNEVGLKIGDASLLEAIFTPLAHKFRPNGVEFFFPSLEDFVKLQRGENRVQDRLTNLKGDDLFISGYPGSFLQDTASIIGQRKDGVTEIYVGLSTIPGKNPTAEEIRELSFALSGTLVNLIAGTDGTNPELREYKLALVERRVRGNNLPFPLTITRS